MTKKNVTKPKQVKPETLGLLLTAIAQTWPGEQTQPGIALSRLPHGQFYGSICRYRDQYGNGRYVVHSHTADTVGEVLRNLSEFMIDKIETMTKLREAVR